MRRRRRERKRRKRKKRTTTTTTTAKRRKRRRGERHADHEQGFWSGWRSKAELETFILELLDGVAVGRGLSDSEQDSTFKVGETPGSQLEGQEDQERAGFAVGDREAFPLLLCPRLQLPILQKAEVVSGDKLLQIPFFKETAQEDSDDELLDLDQDSDTGRQVDMSLFTLYDTVPGKKETWTLNPVRPCMIIGDTNVGRLPQIQDPRVQVDCFPSASINHANRIVRFKTPLLHQVSKLILSFGLHNWMQGNLAEAESDGGSLLEAGLEASDDGSLLEAAGDGGSLLEAGLEAGLVAGSDGGSLLEAAGDGGSLLEAGLVAGSDGGSLLEAAGDVGSLLEDGLVAGDDRSLLEAAGDGGSLLEAGLEAGSDGGSLLEARLEAGDDGSLLALGKAAARDMAEGKAAAQDMAEGKAAAQDMAEGNAAALLDMAEGKAAALLDVALGEAAALDLALGEVAAQALEGGGGGGGNGSCSGSRRGGGNGGCSGSGCGDCSNLDSVGSGCCRL
ncbi:uncharacterized protein V6R79_016164 [Siganus canaliculatus]